MKPVIWIEIHCDNCGNVIGWNYHNAKSVSKLKEATKGWIFSEEHGNICPECQKELMRKGVVK